MLVRQGVDSVEEARDAKRRTKLLNFSLIAISSWNSTSSPIGSIHGPRRCGFLKMQSNPDGAVSHSQATEQAGWGLMLGGELAVLQAPAFDGLSFDPFALSDDG